MRGLVGIDAGVLDKRVDIRLDRLGVLTARHHADGHDPIEIRIDVSGARDFERGKSARRAQLGDNLLRDDLGRLAQFAGELKSDRSGQFTELQIRRSLQRNVFDREVVLGFAAHRADATQAGSSVPDTRMNASEILDYQR